MFVKYKVLRINDMIYESCGLTMRLDVFAPVQRVVRDGVGYGGERGAHHLDDGVPRAVPVQHVHERLH